MNEIKLCAYGCEQEAKYQLKNGKWCCSPHCNSCPELKRKNSEGGKKSYINGIRLSGAKQYENLPDIIKEKMLWNKGKTKESDERIKKQSDKLKEGFDSGRLIPFFKNKHHTLITKQIQSNKACENNNGYVKTKYYEIFCPYEDKIIKVQGTYELKYAQYLNDLNINWLRNKKINLRYKLFETDYLHTYFPDFYLVDIDEYVEIKGYWWKSKDGRVDDKRKMEAIINYNKDKKINILMKQDLIDLGIKI